MKYTSIYIWYSCQFPGLMSFLLKKPKKQKNKSQRCWRGVGGGWTCVIEWYYKNASSRTYATTSFTMDWPRIFSEKIKNNYDISLDADLSRFYINMIFYSVKVVRETVPAASCMTEFN